MSEVVLETARLRLRPFTADDVGRLHRHWIAPDVRRWLWDGREVARDEVVAIVDESRAAFAAGGAGFWVIEHDGAFVGFVGFRAMPDSDDLELYYGLEPASWGQGVATEASRAVMERLGARYVRTDPTGAFGTTIVYVARRA